MKYVLETFKIQLSTVDMWRRFALERRTNRANIDFLAVCVLGASMSLFYQGWISPIRSAN